jgi:ABC-type transport system involved in cytochrome c biogenesis permease subunit
MMILCAWLGMMPLTVAAQEELQEPRSEYWSDEVVDLFATLPVQDGGRVKPLSSVAGLRLLTFNGKRTLKLADGTKLDPNRWLLDVLFFPELAADYPSFRIQDGAVLTVMGLQAKEKRDWYSYNELIPGREALYNEAQGAAEVEAAERDSLDRQSLKLYQDLYLYENLSSLLGISRSDYPTESDPALVELLGPPQEGVSWMLPHATGLLSLRASSAEGTSTELATTALIQTLQASLNRSGRALTILPPATIDDGHDHDDSVWWNPADLISAVFRGDGEHVETQLNLFRLLEQLDRQKHDVPAFTATLRAFHRQSVDLATARGEFKYIPLEVDLYRWDPFTKSLVFFLIAFLLCAFGFLIPKQNWLPYASTGMVTIGLGFAIFGIVMRCIIRERPPVVTLYDTILFITAVAVLASMFMEWLTRQRIAMFLAAFLGVAGMFLASRYELKEVASAGDTMSTVMAVLDTNYYLAIHVTTISIGYAGGLLAAAIAHVWIFGKLFGLKKGDKEFYKGITRMVYGTVCFSLLFSLFGTIMGGVWANDSWGRFWGWDPKENGALLICIWMLVVLHARMGGYIRDRGLANMALLGGIVVSMSWWGVNLLNVGLHSYGFTSGVAMTLYIYWGIEALVLALSVAHGLARKQGTPPPPPPAEASKA